MHLNSVEYRPKGQLAVAGAATLRADAGFLDVLPQPQARRQQLLPGYHPSLPRRLKAPGDFLLPNLPFLCVLMASEVTQKIAEHRVAYHAVLALLEA